jgi:hypothetical protein
MNQLLSVLVGLGFCCFIPLIAFVAGIYYARHGLPFAIRWNGFGRTEDEEVV